ncbi:PREDICTED: uncharacterized protein LOC108611746 isoform X5 [Drosophila arizonae]|uniref:Uncharacterized protein LOC108611746 isoform X5 n=1 Tax=Drosophila arizonae TaxID=7263 RepID=A0ABM1NYI3_DROAR|nr:PREDICTED: uncharacterized protein LOC108611746 isoform X5 [Drosophila arizonae]
MQRNVMWLWLWLLVGLLSLEANANDQIDLVHGEKVLPEPQQQQQQQQPPAVEHGMEHDKSAVWSLEFEHRLREHLRHLDKYQETAWEPSTAAPHSQPQPRRRHQHKSLSNAIRHGSKAVDIDYPNSYPQETQQPAEGQMLAAAVAGDTQWLQRLHRHRQQKQLREKEVQALKAQRENSSGWNDAANRYNNNADNNNNYAHNRIGSQTAHKEKLLGTPEAVLNARREREEAKVFAAKANAHIEEVLREHSCHLPQKRCMSAGRDPSKIYFPHCTFVHRCSEDSGCCHSRTEICAPKRTHKVEKYFFVKTHKDRRSKPEMLTFVNHTECHCIDRSNYYAEGIISSNGAVVQRATMLNCNCPVHFERILQNDGQCRCDCSSSNYDCDYRKRGSEHFSLEDRKCIKEGRCKPPTCQYGPYMEKIGRCPNYHEQTSHPMNNYNAVDMS